MYLQSKIGSSRTSGGVNQSLLSREQSSRHGTPGWRWHSAQSEPILGAAGLGTRMWSFGSLRGEVERTH